METPRRQILPRHRGCALAGRCAAGGRILYRASTCTGSEGSYRRVRPHGLHGLSQRLEALLVGAFLGGPRMAKAGAVGGRMLRRLPHELGVLVATRGAEDHGGQSASYQWQNEEESPIANGGVVRGVAVCIVGQIHADGEGRVQGGRGERAGHERTSCDGQAYREAEVLVRGVVGGAHGEHSDAQGHGEEDLELEARAPAPPVREVEAECGASARKGAEAPGDGPKELSADVGRRMRQ
mmetsp:Transcript_82337/g.245545  ORF Transcript_82337/g.245545 Transcript_82337/m.245545 type:complete len:238 (+) Transcript_82337:75-788(+)